MLASLIFFYFLLLILWRYFVVFMEHPWHINIHDNAYCLSKSGSPAHWHHVA